MAFAECPTCGASVNVGIRPRMGQRFSCSDCDTYLQIVEMDPLELDWPYDEDDDEEYDLEYR